MKAKQLKEALSLLDDDAEVIVWASDDETNREVYALTVDTDMRDGMTVLVICSDQEAGNLRDYEHHPAFENSINAWIFGKDTT